LTLPYRSSVGCRLLAQERPHGALETFGGPGVASTYQAGHGDAFWAAWGVRSQRLTHATFLRRPSMTGRGIAWGSASRISGQKLASGLHRRRPRSAPAFAVPRA
jgi:hypothetical protein